MITSGRNYFKIENGEIIFTGKYMEVYISDYYYKKGASEIIGDYFRTLGILNFRIFDDVEGTKPGKLKVFNIPAEIYTYPSGGYEEKTLISDILKELIDIGYGKNNKLIKRGD